MADDDDTTSTDGADGDSANADDSTTSVSSGKIQPAMTETQIRDAGLAIDVPFESGQPQPERLSYADLGMPWTPPAGWPPSEGEPEDAEDPNA